MVATVCIKPLVCISMRRVRALAKLAGDMRGCGFVESR